MPIRNYFLSNLQNAIRKSKRKKVRMEVKTLHTMAIVIIAIVYCLSVTTAQSNYASQANNIEYHGEGLPDEATLDGKVTKLDDISPIIFLNQTKAVLNCAAGSMQVELKFNERFYGTAYANFDRNSACQISGKGDMGYILELPLKGCGTKQEPQRVFTNNIIIRFHPGLEMDGDEIITIVCRYPPPVAPIPAGFPAPIITDIVPALILEPPLKGIQILFIICAIMFLTLLLIGLGISYYCLRRQPIPIVRRIIHVGSGSEITALETGSIDDVYTQTVTEKTTVEDIERHKRVVTNYKAMPVVDTNWNVTIRNYQEYSDPVWEDFSDISSASGVATTRHIPTQIIIPNSTHLSKNDQFLQSPELVCNIKPIELPPEDKSVSNWDILIRVLQDVEIPDIAITKVELQSTNAVGQLSYNDKAKWKEIITTESTLRTMLTEAVIREDFERIRADARYEKLFEPQSWEIIMRILTPPDDAELRKSRRKRRETWDTRSRRSSLPTLYEYDSDGRSSVRTISQEPIVIIRQNRDISNSAKPLSRKSSHSSYSTNNAEYRSLTEVLIDYVKPRYSDSLSEGSSLSTNRNYEDDNYDRRSIQHSSSHPSLARSASEFTEQWIAPDETASSLSENEAIFEHIPRVARENRTQYIETSFKSRSYEW
ncbi:uncharacterized protein LOC131431865 isoform X5 [Malaya genurostris]|uniref:uncharacterized protein LOC131431865 isoform X5 n=1 Tax=Malaya genurostris TaxID=325434 RepID=UPI0026F3BFC8|nr:uncharacterized protein LOC131431865 isoform X5 [Malaya genurostris]